MIQGSKSVEGEKYKMSPLKHVDTRTFDGLPTVADIYCEMLPDDLTHKSEIKEVKNFIRNKLKRVHTIEHTHLPTTEEIKQEKIMTRDEVKDFDHSHLKHVQTKETKMLPSLNTLRAELLPDILPTRPELHKLQMFVRSYLKHVETVVKQKLPTWEEIQEEAHTPVNEIKTFDKSRLKRSNTIEKNTLPGLETLWSEMLPDELPTKAELKELVAFAHTDLKHVDPNIKYRLPSTQDIVDEAIDTRAEVITFKRSFLKRANTEEKNPLPGPDVLREELYPDYLPPKSELEAIKRFVKSSLKHVETVDKNLLPTLQEIITEKVILND